MLLLSRNNLKKKKTYIQTTKKRLISSCHGFKRELTKMAKIN